jgi:hypothetical protein
MFLLATMLATLDPRLALALSLLLLLAAAAPIVWGWLAVLPAEREPFTRPGELPSSKPRDPFAIFLLANITVSLLLRIPGWDFGSIAARAGRIIPPEWADHAVMIGYIWFGFVPGLGAAYAAVRANPLRLQLLLGGVLTLSLWFGGPWLIHEIAGAP